MEKDDVTDCWEITHMVNADTRQRETDAGLSVYYAEYRADAPRVDVNREFFPIASPIRQLDACVNLIESFENPELEEPEHSGLTRWKDIISGMRAHSRRLNEDPETARFIIDATVLLVDAAKVDLIDSGSRRSMGGARGSYSRGSWREDFFRNQEWADELGGIHTMTVREAEQFYTRFEPDRIISSVAVPHNCMCSLYACNSRIRVLYVSATVCRRRRYKISRRPVTAARRFSIDRIY